jgi:TPR repeat protein
MTEKSPKPRARHHVPTLFLLTSLLLAGPAAADLFSAEKAYGAGDYEHAFEGFKELAELGQPTAQFNLAVMYANGQGTRQSEIFAYAWATLAAENGMEKAKALVESLRPTIALAPGSEQIAADIEAQYGHTVLDQRLMPKIAASESSDRDDRARCRPLHTYIPGYPQDALRQGIEGAAYAEFSLMPDGRIRNPHIIYSVPAGVFEPTLRNSLLHSEFVTAIPGTKTVQCTIFYQFTIQGAKFANYNRLDEFVRKTLQQAQSGDPNAQMLYGMLLVGLPQLNKPRSQALPWFLKSAQAGAPAAQFQVGYSLLKGWGCDCEENKGLDWLRRAAQAGEPDAEVTLAMYALRGSPDESRQRQAKLWLEQAAGSGSHDGKLYLAALLAAAPGEQARDPKRALALLDEVFRDVKDDPTAFEIRAAADASAGKFKEAVQSESKALLMARRLSWDVTALNERLANYTANQPWHGALLDF